MPLRGKELGDHPPTRAELLEGLLKAQSDVDFCVWRDDCIRQGWGTVEQDYADVCDTIGYTPPRIHNIGPDNQWGYTTTPDEWGYAIGPECCWPANLGAVPPDLTDDQIAQINGRKRNASTEQCEPTLQSIVL